MFERLRKRLPRTKSVPQPHEHVEEPQSSLTRSYTLTPSDENLVSKLSFAPETQTIDRAPAHKSPSVGTRFSGRTVVNNTERGLLSLPTEILATLQSYLSLGSEVALRHSCSRFFHLYSTPSFYLKGEELFAFLCMTERDQDPTKLDKLVCGTCKQLHPRAAFASSEVTKKPLDRDCRQVWLCAHKFLGYSRTIKNIKAGPEAPFRVESIEPCSRCRDSIRNRSAADRPEKGTSQMTMESEKNESLLISKIGIMQRPTPVYNVRGSNNSSGMYKAVFDVKEVSMTLQAIDFRLCPHLKLGDPYILGKFCRSCTNTQKLPPGVRGPPCIAETDKKEGQDKTIGRCKGSCYTRGCKTKFMFQARESLTPDASGRRQIWLIIVIYRWLGPLLSDAKDRSWRDHAIQHKERIEMKQKWTNWTKDTRGQHCIPNWSYALLHPDDCNIR